MAVGFEAEFLLSENQQGLAGFDGVPLIEPLPFRAITI